MLSFLHDFSSMLLTPFLHLLLVMKKSFKNVCHFSTRWPDSEELGNNFLFLRPNVAVHSGGTGIHSIPVNISNTKE